MARGAQLVEVVHVSRRVTEQHPLTHIPLKQEIEVEDEHGRVYHFAGEAIASTPLAAWPNASTYDSVYRWTDDQGRKGLGPCQGISYEAYHHAMKRRRQRAQATET